MNANESYTVPCLRNLPFMSGPTSLTTIIVGYLIFVYYAGPRLMAKRRPFELRNVILTYDAAQIAFNVGLLIYVSNHITDRGYIRLIRLCAGLRRNGVGRPLLLHLPAEHRTNGLCHLSVLYQQTVRLGRNAVVCAAQAIRPDHRTARVPSCGHLCGRVRVAACRAWRPQCADGLSQPDCARRHVHVLFSGRLCAGAAQPLGTVQNPSDANANREFRMLIVCVRPTANVFHGFPSCVCVCLAGAIRVFSDPFQHTAGGAVVPVFACNLLASRGY